MRILIIGLGSIGRKHVNAIRLISPTAVIFALRSRTDADDLPGVQNVFSYDDLAKLSLNFAIIANPTSEHKYAISNLLQYRIPLFIEKPVYSSLDIKEIIEEIRDKAIFTYVACNLRFVDSIRFIKEQFTLQRNKRLNEVNVYCGSYLPDWRPGTDFRNTYSAVASLGGGVHIDLIHEIDYLYWLFGIPNYVTRKFKNQSSLSITSYDYANYLLEYEGFCVNVVLNYYRRDPKRSLELVFSDETWYTDILRNKVMCGDKVLFSSEQRMADTYLTQMEYFINSTISHKTSMNSVSDAYEVLKICLEK